jgi:hypothetical protein
VPEKHMKITLAKPQDRFSGLDDGGFLVYPNNYHCKFCNFGVYFTESSLSHGVNAYSGEQVKLPKLKGEERKLFESKVIENISTCCNCFALGFYCPKCEAPVAITFEFNDISYGLTRYKPMSIFELEVAPNKSLQAMPKSGAPEL